MVENNIILRTWIFISYISTQYKLDISTRIIMFIRYEYRQYDENLSGLWK